MAELEEHTEGPVLADPAGQVGRRDAIGFGDGEDIVAVEDVAAKFVEKIEDARRIGNHLVDRRQAIGAVDRAVGQDGRFLDVDDGIDAEAADAFIDPEIGRIIEGLADGRILPIQIWLFDGEGVQVILLPFFAPRPGRAAEDRAPVRRRRTVLFGIAPDVPVGLVVSAAAFRFLEPGVPVRRMVIDQVHDDADIPLLPFGNESIHISHRAIARVDGRIVADVIAVIDHRRRVDRRQPDGADAEFPEIIQVTRHAGNIAFAAARRVLEAAGVNLIDSRLLPPFQGIHKNLLENDNRCFAGDDRLVRFFLHLRIFCRVGDGHDDDIVITGFGNSILL